MTTPSNATDGVNKDHNVGDLKKLIAECRDGMLKIKEERKELNLQAKDIRERLTNAGQQIKAFDFSLKLYEMEPEARNEYIDNLRLNMEAMSIGAQGTLFMNEAGSEAAHDVHEPETVN